MRKRDRNTAVFAPEFGETENMSHLMNWPDQKRMSLESVHVLPGGKIRIACWGMCPGLEFIATTDDDWGAAIDSNQTITDKEKFSLGTKLTEKQCKVTDIPCKTANVAVKEFQFFDVGHTMTARIVLKMGSAVWDWMRVHVKINVPAEISNRETGTGTLKVEVMWAVPDGVGINSLPHATTVARLILAKHGMGLQVGPSLSWNPANYIRGFEDGVIASFHNWGNIGKLAAKLPPKPDSVIVVMCNLRDEPIQNNGNHKKVTGATFNLDGSADNTQKKRFIVLNVHAASVDGATLIHEMGHAAGFCCKDSVHSDDSSHFMSYGTMRNEAAGSIGKFQEAFFCSKT
jgi:hypothetical protein